MNKKLILQALGVLLVIPAIVLLFTVVPRWALGAYVRCCGAEVDGVVASKRESVEFYYENWRHRTEVAVRYRPQGSAADETVTHEVDPKLFDRLEVGAPVRVRYASGATLRHAANGAGLAAASLASREVIETRFWAGLLDAVYMFGVFTLFVLSFFLNDMRLRRVGAVGLASSAAGQMMLGFLVFPALFLLWRKLRGVGFGRVLLLSIPLTVIVMAARIPWPAAAPAGPAAETTATVAQVKTVDRIWGALAGHGRIGIGVAPRTVASASDADTGTTIDAPFLLLDLVFTPPGARAPVHAVDRVDASSAPGLTAGAQVRVVVPQSDPRSARLADAQRSYAWDALIYLLLWTAGMCLVGLPLAWPLVAFGLWMARSFGLLPKEANAQVAMPPAQPPR